MKRFLGQSVQLIFTANLLTISINAVTLADNKSAQPAPRTVRVTTGIVEVHGWEQGLIKGNPNLGRWHWDPIYSYKQGYAKIAPFNPKVGGGSRTVTGKPSTYKYNYPAHKDNKPAQIPYSPQAMAEVQARLSSPPKVESNLNGVLQEEKISGKLYPAKPSVATYGEYAHRTEALNTDMGYHSQKADVYGKLLSQTKTKNKRQK